MRIPRMKVEVARDLLDLGVHQIYDLEGRSPEVLWEELKKIREAPASDSLPWFRLAVYYAETPTPDRSKLQLQAWMD